ncbi:MAG: histidine phosphatase family protein [Spirochaetota bacterium]
MSVKNSDAFFRGFGYRREGCRYAVEKHSDAQAVIVCHLGLSMALLSHIFRLPLDRVWASFWLAPASITGILMEERSERWAVPRLVSAGDIGHLYAAGIDNNTKGLQGNIL